VVVASNLAPGASFTCFQDLEEFQAAAEPPRRPVPMRPAGALAIPLSCYASDRFRGAAMHRESLEPGSLGPGMRLPFALSAATEVAAFLRLLLLRLDLETRRVRAARIEARLAADVGN